ncbi:MAG: inner membrane-spanning protein YciB, partial [Granulosicoccus sp.]
MAERKISQGLKSALELGPVLLFFAAYLKMRDATYTIGGVEYSGFIVATVVFIPILLLSTGILWKLTGKLSRMQVLTAFMVIFFGGLTVYFNDEQFFKIKTTIVYGFFAGTLGLGLLLGKSWLGYVMDEFLPLTDEGWLILTKRLAAMFASLAIANEIVWRTMSTDAWVKIETFGFPVALFAFFMLQTPLFQK